MEEAVEAKQSRLQMGASDGEAYEENVENDLDDDCYVMYKDRSEWSDIEPMPQDDGPDAVVQIDYSPKFKDVYDYFRGVLKKQEYSQRVLGLTSDAIMLNAANYTVWQYRRDVLEALGIPCLMTKDGLSDEFAKEFEFSRNMIEENQKNYQVWHHRKILVSWASGYNDELFTFSLKCDESLRKLADQELDLTERILSRDSKNYHAWQHRQWVLYTFKTYDFELDYVTALIQDDVRNNSAWNQRYFVVSNSQTLSKKELEREISFTWSHIKFAISNESPWNYMRGILRLLCKLDDDTSHMEIQQKVLKTSFDLFEAGSKSFPMLSFMLDIIDDVLSSPSGTNELFGQALKICDILINEDDIRKKFWEHSKKKMLNSFNEKYGTKEEV